MRRTLLGLALCLPVVGVFQSQGQVTYDEIAGVVYRSCTPCHSPGGPAPFSLRNYDEVSRRAERIGVNVISSAMPPCQVRSDFGQFSSIPGLSTVEMIAIRRWATGGAHRGMTNPVAIPATTHAWRLGKPHLLLHSTAISAPSEGGVHWIFAKIKMPRGGAIRGIELRPNDPLTIRQATIGWAKRGVNPMPNTTAFPEGVMPIGSWAFGYYTWRSPRGTGVYVPGGSELHVMLQCQAIGKEGDASFDLALYFEGKPRTPIDSIVLEKRGFTLAKGEKVRMEASHTLVHAAKITSLLPEFRYACERVELTAQLPQGETRELMAGRWDVYWTGAYNFINPPILPAGTELKLSAYYNNGFDAAHGPDTRMPIRQGAGLDDEICKVTIQVIEVEEGSDSFEAASKIATSQ